MLFDEVMKKAKQNGYFRGNTGSCSLEEKNLVVFLPFLFLRSLSAQKKAQPVRRGLMAAYSTNIIVSKTKFSLFSFCIEEENL